MNLTITQRRTKSRKKEGGEKEKHKTGQESEAKFRVCEKYTRK
jgi:hypothetical protein